MYVYELRLSLVTCALSSFCCASKGGKEMRKRSGRRATLLLCCFHPLLELGVSNPLLPRSPSQHSIVAAEQGLPVLTLAILATGIQLAFLPGHAAWTKRRP